MQTHRGRKEFDQEVSKAMEGSRKGELRTAGNYLLKHFRAGHMNNAAARARKLPIGSGVIESTVRRVVNLRLKGASVYWKEGTTEDMLVLRCLYKAISGKALPNKELRFCTPPHNPPQNAKRSRSKTAFDEKEPDEKKLSDKLPERLPSLDALVEPTAKGDPMTPLRWTTKSTRRPCEMLNDNGFEISHTLVCRLLHELEYPLSGNWSAEIKPVCEFDKRLLKTEINQKKMGYYVSSSSVKISGWNRSQHQSFLQFTVIS